MNVGKWISLIAFVISLYILWQIQQLLLLLLITALNRLVLQLQRFGIKRGFVVLLSLSGLIALRVGFFLLVQPTYTEQVQQLIVLLPTGFERIQG